MADNSDILYTSRNFNFRIINQNDEDFYKSIYSDLKLMRLVDIDLNSLNISKAFKQSLKLSKKPKPTYLALIIEEQETSRRAGLMGITNIDYDNSMAEIGILLNREFHGQGLPIHFTKATIEYIFYTLNLQTIVANLNKHNLPVLKIIKHLGFSKAQNASHPEAISYSLSKPAKHSTEVSS